MTNVSVYINKGDPIPAGSYVLGEFANVLVEPLRAANLFAIMTDGVYLVPAIARSAADVRVTTFDFCPAEARRLDRLACHNARLYQEFAARSDRPPSPPGNLRIIR